MSGGPTITVVVPTRDRPRLLAAAIDSLLRQTRPVDQIVVVDDGSSFENRERIDAIVASSPTIERVGFDEARGPAAARNLGLERARGSYVAFLDDDDLVHPRFHETALEAFATRGGVDAIVCASECVFVPGGFDETTPITLLFDYRALTEHPLRRFDAGNPVPGAVLETRPISAFLRYLIPVHTILVRREAIRETRFPEAIVQGEDTLFWIRLAAKGVRFAPLAQVFAYVRRHAGNTTRSRRRYAKEIQDCYVAMLDEGLLRDRDDAFLAHLKLLWFRASTRSPGWVRHFGPVASSPDLLAREMGFWLRNLRERRRLLRYYFEP